MPTGKSERLLRHLLRRLLFLSTSGGVGPAGNRLFSLLCLAAFLCTPIAAQTAPPKRDEPTRVVFSVEITRLKGHRQVVVPAYINGVGPFRMLVNTGSPVSLLTRESLTRLKKDEYLLQPADKSRSVFGVELRERMVPLSFRVGKGSEGSAGNDARFLLLPRKLLAAFGPSAKEIEGILGADYLQSFALDFNLAKNRLTFYEKGGLSLSERASAGMGRAWVVPLYNPEAARFYVALAPRQPSMDHHDREQKVLPLLLDTGSDRTLMAEKRLAPYARRTGKVLLLRSSQADLTLAEYQLPARSIGIGEWSWANRMLWASPPDATDEGDALGMDVLSETHFLIDFPALVLYVSPDISLDVSPTRKEMP